MKPEDVKKLIPAFLEGDLDAQTRETVRQAIAQSEELQAEVSKYEQSWDMLGDWKDIEPNPGYVSRFWTELDEQTTWYETAWNNLRAGLFAPKMIPAVVTACVVLIVGALVSQNMVGVQETEILLTKIGPEEIEFLENYELVENLDIIQDLEFYEDFDVLLEWDTSET